MEHGNHLADEAASLHKWHNRDYKLSTMRRKFILTYKGTTIFDNIKKNIQKIWYEAEKNNWKDRQPIHTAYLHETVDPKSYPKFGEAYANLHCKFMTGTIWTNKLKKRLRMTQDDNCMYCSLKGSDTIEDAAHILGNCPQTVAIHDHIWADICNIGRHKGLDIATWTPWFHTSTHPYESYNMPLTLGDKGLTPLQFRTRVTASNKHMHKTNLHRIVDKIISFWRWAKRDQFIQRMRLNCQTPSVSLPPPQ